MSDYTPIDGDLGIEQAKTNHRVAFASAFFFADAVALNANDLLT
jgi:hypothetical protein